jgi:hypothetical protein
LSRCGTDSRIVANQHRCVRVSPTLGATSRRFFRIDQRRLSRDKGRTMLAGPGIVPNRRGYGDCQKTFQEPLGPFHNRLLKDAGE